MKKIFIPVVCTLTLFACGKEPVQKKSPDNTLDKCTLRFSWWGGDDRHEATLKAIELWNTLYPDIEIKAEYGGWDGWTEKVNTQISGGSEPDIMQINYNWLVTLSGDGEGFYDLSQLDSFLDLSGFDEDILSFGTVNGHLNAVPVSLTGRGLFYNSEIFGQVGAEYPHNWNELLSLGETFRQYDRYPLDLDIQSGGTAWYLAVVYVQQTTGKEFIDMNGNLGFTVEDIETALEFYRQLEENHVIRNVRTRTDEDGNTALYQSPEFIEGNIAGVLEWGSAVGKYESVLDEGVLETGPFLDDGKGNSDGWFIKPSLLYAVSANTQYPDEAGAFIDFLLNNPECADILGTSRGIPASRYAEERLESTGKLAGLAQQNAELLDSMNTVTVSPYMELARMKEFYNTAIEKVSYNKADIHETAQELYDNITGYLENITSTAHT
ncbi:MAG: ABC transporter substrate-binding protein [Ruminococcus flavefaciens]|nr:ABC transporter substrate-binding protein [Ruminococcus flavefaciens]